MTGTPSTVDQASTTPEPRWPRLVVVRLLLPLGILGALALSAAATIDLAHRHGVPDHVQPAAVAMLEIVSAAGTLLAIFGTSKRLRGRAMAAVAGASAVQLVAGVSAYGWFGAVAPLALVGLVHLAAEAWQELRADGVRPSTTQVATSTDEAEPVESADHLADQWSTGPTGPLHGPLTLTDHLRTLPFLPSERALLDVLGDGWTRHRVKTALREARTGLREVSA